MSWQATHWVIENSKHKGSALLTLLCIANCANEVGEKCFPSIEKLARDTRLSKRQVLRIISTLETSGELCVHHSEGRYPNNYSFPLMNSDKMSPLKTRTVTSRASNSDISGTNGDILGTNSDIAMSPDPSLERSKEQPLDPPHSGAAFREALESFEKERSTMRKPLTANARRLLYKKLAGWPEPVATQALEDSVINRWQGVFEPRNGNGARPPSGKAEASVEAGRAWVAEKEAEIARRRNGT